MIAAKPQKRAVRPIENERRTVPIARCVLDDLQRDAVRRNISVPELVRRLVGTIAEERMVDSILDDTEYQP